jgi:hypothetical protein
MSFYELGRDVFSVIANSKRYRKKQKEQKFQELSDTPFLFSSHYLESLLQECETKEDYEAIWEHIYRHNASEVESYSRLEKKIIHQLWNIGE